MFKAVLILAILIFGSTFCVVNRQEISLRYFFGWDTGPFPVYLLILASLGGGAALGFTLGWRRRRRLRARLRALEAQAEDLRARAGPPAAGLPSAGPEALAPRPPG